MKTTRREFMTAAAAGLGTCVVAGAAGAADPKPPARPVPMLHVSDLFRPHNDPDDHWDLACVYALAHRGSVDLRGILIDYPTPERKNDPDVLAVAQMNYMTGKAAPVMVGSPRWINRDDAARPDSENDLRGVRAMLEILHRSPEPVVISILGSCRDVAIAGSLEPELFARNCRAIYLNAGSGTPDKSKAARLEWNVHLDPAAYATIFRLPCAVYWMPCFEEVRPAANGSSQPAEWGTFYRFRQGDVLPQLSDRMQNFFAYVFLHGHSEAEQTGERGLRPDWLRYLVGPKDAGLLARVNAMDRNMWCTGGFLHAAGMAVSRAAEILPQAEAGEPVFTFDPIEVTCSPAGITEWQPALAATNRYIFHVRDTRQYAAAMTAAMRRLLVELP